MFGRKKTGQGDEASASESQRGSGPGRSSRPDASAVLDRQPVPPVRKPADYGAAATAAATRRPASAAGNAVGGAAQTPATKVETPMDTNEGEGKKLIVGQGIRLSGEIQACEKLVVEGEVHADLTGALVLEISENGLFKGRATVDYAEISGSFDGELTVRDRLLLRGSGRIDGDLRYAEMEIERGGRIRGTIGEIETAAGNGVKKPAAAAEKAEPAPAASAASASASQEFSLSGEGAKSGAQAS